MFSLCPIVVRDELKMKKTNNILNIYYNVFEPY